MNTGSDLLNTVLFFSSLVFLSCSLDYQDTMIAEELSEEIPQVEMFGVTYVIVKDGSPEVILRADSARSYSKRNITEMNNLNFREFDTDGEVLNQGSGKFMSYNHETGDAEITGDIILDSREEEAGLNADTLFWTEAEHRLSGEKDEEVTLHRDDGNEMSGREFHVDMSTKTMEFMDSAGGIYHAE